MFITLLLDVASRKKKNDGVKWSSSEMEYEYRILNILNHTNASMFSPFPMRSKTTMVNRMGQGYNLYLLHFMRILGSS